MFMYSEEATKFCEISTVGMFYVVTVKSRVEISQNFAAFSEYMNFTKPMKTKNIFCLDHNFFEVYLKFFVHHSFV